MAQIKPAAALAQKHPPGDPNLAGDHPLEPGSGIPARRLVASAAERIATPDPASGGAWATEMAADNSTIATGRRYERILLCMVAILIPRLQRRFNPRLGQSRDHSSILFG